jgi:DNA-binding LytR/AlgR family response regulator
MQSIRLLSVRLQLLEEREEASMTQNKISESKEDKESDWFVSVLRAGGVVVALACSQVSWVSAERQGHFIRLHTVTGESHRLRGTLKSLLQRWAKYGLAQIHKSFLVFPPQIRKLRQKAEGSVVHLGSGASAAVLPVSRRKLQEIKKQLKLREIKQQLKRRDDAFCSASL